MAKIQRTFGWIQKHYMKGSNTVCRYSNQALML